MDTQHLRQQLQQAEERIRALREEKGRLKKVFFESAKGAVAQSTRPTRPSQRPRRRRTPSPRSRTSLSRPRMNSSPSYPQLGDAERGGFGAALSGGNGRAEISRRLDLDRGETRVDVPLGSLIGAGLRHPPGGSEVATSRAPLAQPARTTDSCSRPSRSVPSMTACSRSSTSCRAAREGERHHRRVPLATAEKAELALALRRERGRQAAGGDGQRRPREAVRGRAGAERLPSGGDGLRASGRPRCVRGGRPSGRRPRLPV